MKKSEVPQDDEAVYENKFGNGLLKYATEENNEYTTVQSVGWEPEIVALKQAWEEVELKISEAREMVEKGQSSPVYYYMEKKLLDPGILASYMNKWQWQIKRHFKPNVFAKLDQKTLAKYASVFGISTDQLMDISKDPINKD